MDWVLVAIAVIMIIVLIVGTVVSRRAGTGGISAADAYQQELARRSRAYTQQQAQAAAARRPVAPTRSTPAPGRTGYSGASAYRSTPAVGQNETHGQNLPSSGQNSGSFSGQQQTAVDPRLVQQLRMLNQLGQQAQAVAMLRRYTGVSQAEAVQFVQRL